jgi:hypothetical protein
MAVASKAVASLVPVGDSWKTGATTPTASHDHKSTMASKPNAVVIASGLGIWRPSNYPGVGVREDLEVVRVSDLLARIHVDQHTHRSPIRKAAPTNRKVPREAGAAYFREGGLAAKSRKLT